jgi:acyl-CoA thioesterase-1
MLAVFFYCVTPNTEAGTEISKIQNILVLGDSLSAEYGLAKNSGWVNLISERLRSANFDIKIVNASISGETTSGGLERITGLINKHNPNLLIVELGGNDALRGLPLETTKSNLESIIKLAKKNNCKILLLGMQIPTNYGKKYSQDFQRVYGDLAKSQQISLVPFFLEGVALDPKLFQPDRIHPNEAAQKILSDNVWVVLKKIL